jgi:UDP-glucose 4-epimerase
VNKKIFITGGAGFIGSHLVDRLMDEGYQVTVYDNLSSGKEGFIEQHAGNGAFKFIKADLLDINQLTQSMSGHELVFHLAANPDIRYGIIYSDTDLKQNTIVTYNVLESMRLNGIKEVAFSSTSAIYGEATIVPTPENYEPLFPISLYGASKLACEGLCSAFSHTYGMRCFIYRFANIVGGRGTHGIIYDFINKLKKDPTELEILGDGEQTKSYLLVDDCVDAMLYVYQNAREKFNVFNLGSGDQVNIKEIARGIIEKSGLKNVKMMFKGGDRGWPGDVPQMSLAIDKLSDFGWKSKHNSMRAVEIAIERMIEECRL